MPCRLKGAFLSFRKFICNLLLDVHPICINKWSHPFSIINIYKFYLNARTICQEYVKNIKVRKGIKEKYYMNHLIENNCIAAIKWFLANKIAVYNNNDALSVAAKFGHLEIVKLLLAAGADIHTTYDRALINAVDYGHLEVVRLLLEKGADVEANNNLALSLAVGNNYLEIVKLLLDNGADIHNDDEIIIFIARKCDNKQMIELLLDRGAYSSEF